MGGVVFRAWTFVGTPGACNASANTVLSLWKAPMPAGTNESGACAGTYVDCNNNDTDNSPCSTVEYKVANYEAGDFVVKVHNYSSTVAIPSYGLLVQLR